MRIPTAEPHWPRSWVESRRYDIEEFGENPHHPQYRAAYRQRFDRTLALVDAALGGRGRILDVAAAQGNFSLALAERGYDVTWNDLRSELADYVRLKHVRGGIEFLPGNAFELGIEGRYDLVLATEIIEHVAHPDQFLAKLACLVRAGGHVVLTTPNGALFSNRLPRFSDCPDPSVFESGQFKPNSDGHIFLLYPDELAAIGVRLGLELRRLELFTSFVLAGHHKTWLLHRILPAGLLRGVDRWVLGLGPAVRRRSAVQLACWFTKPAHSTGGTDTAPLSEPVENSQS
jgi:2-polyprenyl-3-methyl-5-hydroxy-6-metoxy-1,4-benzoquinol methylase